MFYSSSERLVTISAMQSSQHIRKTHLEGVSTQASSGWHLEVQPGDTMIRLVLLTDNTAFISSVVCALRHHTPLRFCWNPIPFAFFCLWFPYLIKPDKYQVLIHPCFFLCNNNKTFRCFYIFDSSISFTSKYYHWW